VDRAWVKSLWTPSVRWTEVTEDISQWPGDAGLYNGSPQTVEQLKQNTRDRASLVVWSPTISSRA
jgi:hypothetical protein